MHVAHQLRVDQFAVRVEGGSADASSALPSYDALDRFGLVVTETLGGLGAGLLLELATAMFYEVRPSRRDLTPAYPEIYVFHVGGTHGDFSPFDVWPPRKEVVLPTNDPLVLLEALNAHGITRLALPIGPLGDTAGLGTGHSTWAEQGAFIDRTRSCFVYSPDGQVAAAEIELEAIGAVPLENVQDTVDPVPPAQVMADGIAAGLPVALAGPSAPSDGLRWASRVMERASAQPVSLTPAADQHRARLRQPRYRESYRRSEPEAALAMLAGLGPVSSRSFEEDPP